MALTRDFKETIQARVQRDPVFREELLKEGIQCLLAGEMDVGKAILRDYIKATMGFAELSSLTEKSAKSLMRMFGPKGNPQAKNLFEVLEHLQRQEGVQLRIHTVRRNRHRRLRTSRGAQRSASRAA
jgi:DNA-binding phage protein